MRIIFNICTFSNIFCIFAIMEVNGKQERAIIHLEMDGAHYYYGNLKALCDAWDKDILGVAYSTLRNYGIAENKPYQGKNCIIRKGVILTSPRKQ